MRIYLDRYFNFFTRGRRPWVEVEVPAPSRLSDVLAQAGIPAGEVHLAVINGQACDPQEAVINERDRVKLFPPFGGG